MSTERQSRALTIGSSTIVFDLVRAKRRRVAIEVNPDLSIVVRVPDHASEDAIRAIVRRKNRWISRQLRFFASFLPRTPARRFVSGETHLYLGRQYQLKVVRTRGDESVKLGRGLIVIATRTPDSIEAKRNLLKAWYHAHAERVLRERAAECLRHPKLRALRDARVSVRELKRRWGSCSPRGRVTLNVELIRAPRPCIDYVITHELCHLVVRDHSAKFLRLLGQVMPDWAERKKRLEIMLT